jgi:hypothetical protein
MFQWDLRMPNHQTHKCKWLDLVGICCGSLTVFELSFMPDHLVAYRY